MYLNITDEPDRADQILDGDSLGGGRIGRERTAQHAHARCRKALLVER